MTDAILVLNGGSSSLKFAVFEGRDDLPLVLRGSVSSLGQHPRLRVVPAGGAPEIDRSLSDGPIDIDKAFAAVAALLADRDLLRSIGKVGHRIVHGGRDFTEAAQLDRSALEALSRLEPLAPIHQKINLEIVALAASRCRRPSRPDASTRRFMRCGRGWPRSMAFHEG
ncbi:hypothetical protein ACVOMV_26385 (plasmid) [Mesorhizobium atlanticum]|uniref:hypothetical protein n=1 Tax=Mesorhizobium atlanticum TaxID=2233532 RepID=UPI0037048451